MSGNGGRRSKAELLDCLNRLADILKASYHATPRGKTLTELAEITGEPISTLSRWVKGLEQNGFAVYRSRDPAKPTGGPRPLRFSVLPFHPDPRRIA